MKSYGAQAVKNTISCLTSLADQISPKRKFTKLGSRMRYMVACYHCSLKILEAEWSSVKLQTSWKLQPCFLQLEMLQLF